MRLLAWVLILGASIPCVAGCGSDGDGGGSGGEGDASSRDHRDSGHDGAHDSGPSRGHDAAPGSRKQHDSGSSEGDADKDRDADKERDSEAREDGSGARDAGGEDFDVSPLESGSTDEDAEVDATEPLPDSGGVDAETTDAGNDGSALDAGVEDAGIADAAPPDVGAGSPDASLEDASVTEAASPDGGTSAPDANAQDVSVAEAGPPHGGSAIDGGVVESGADAARSCGSCDDGNPCTDDTCQTSTGTCTHSILVGASCNDGVACTVDDMCTSTGSCIGTVTPACTPAVCGDVSALGSTIDIPLAETTATITLGGQPLPKTNEYGSGIGLYFVSHDTGQWHTFATFDYNSNLVGPTITPRVVPGVYDVYYCHNCSTTPGGIAGGTDPTDAFPSGLRVLQSCVSVP